MALVLWYIKKLYPFIATLKINFLSFLRGKSAWPSYRQDTFESHFKAFSSFIRESKNLQPHYVVNAIWWPIFTIDSMKKPNIGNFRTVIFGNSVTVRLIKKLDPWIVGKFILWPVFVDHSSKKKTNFSHFWDFRLADTVMAATHSHRQIQAIPQVFCAFKNNSAIVERPFCGRSLRLPRWKIWIWERNYVLPISHILC